MPARAFSDIRVLRRHEYRGPSLTGMIEVPPEDSRYPRGGPRYLGKQAVLLERWCNME